VVVGKLLKKQWVPKITKVTVLKVVKGIQAGALNLVLIGLRNSSVAVHMYWSYRITCYWKVGVTKRVSSAM
jgi:hypothetical protein